MQHVCLLCSQFTAVAVIVQWLVPCVVAAVTQVRILVTAVVIFFSIFQTIFQKMQKCTISSSSLVCSHYKFINALSLLTTAFSHSSIDKLPSTAKLSLEIGRNYALRLTFTITKLSLIPHEQTQQTHNSYCLKITPKSLIVENYQQNDLLLFSKFLHQKSTLYSG